MTFSSGTIGGTTNVEITLNAAALAREEAFSLKTISEGTIMNNYSAAGDNANGTLVSGSQDNIRWEVTGANTSSGQFSLSIRRGNDTSTQKAVLEQYK